jgi:asparagine synthase (glutamine-hydrolysing)
MAPAIGRWLLADARLKALAFDSLSDLRKRGIVRAGFLDQLLARSLAEDPGRHGRMIWMLMMLEQWFAQRRGLVPAAAAEPREHAAERH